MRCLPEHLRAKMSSVGMIACVLAHSSAVAAQEDHRQALEVLNHDAAHRLFFDYLLREATDQFQARRAALQRAGRSANGIRAYQATLRKKLTSLFGTWPDKTPLNPQTVGTLECDGYRIEKIHFESRPDFHVTANVYVPSNRAGPFPSVLLIPGHTYLFSKAFKETQHLSQLLVSNGFLVMVIDPICQGERYQLLRADGVPATRGGTVAHTLLDVGAMLVGQDVVLYQAWDNIRSVDYLVGRPDVDPARIASTGNSGGGTQTIFLAALDDRIKVAGLSCYVTTRQRKFVNTGPQDGCQNLFNEGTLGFEIADYIILRAPKPMIVLAAERDYFDIEATRHACADTRAVYESFNQPENFLLFEADDEHGYSEPRRRAFLHFARQQLSADLQPPVYPDTTVRPGHDLRVTKTGQVLSEWKQEVSVTDLITHRARKLASSRRGFWSGNDRHSRLRKIRQLVGIGTARPQPTVQRVGTVSRENHTVVKLIIRQEGHVPVPGLLFLPATRPAKSPATLYVDGKGKNNGLLEDAPIETLVDDGRIVLAIDLCGFGETADDPSKNDEGYWTDEYRNSMLALHVGRSLIGQRVEDVFKGLYVLQSLDEVDTRRISLFGMGRAGPVVLHAAALEDAFRDVVIQRSVFSWLDILIAPIRRNNHSHVVPSALLWYDLPNLVSIIAPRHVRIIDPVRPR